MLYLLILSFFTFNIFSGEYAAEAYAWCHQNLSSISKPDLKKIEELIELSRHRSALNLEIQEFALTHLDLSWNIWSKIGTIRMDPSKDFIAEEQIKALDNSHQRYISLIRKYREISAKYAEFINKINQKSIFESDKAYMAVDIMRTNARKKLLNTSIKLLPTYLGLEKIRHFPEFEEKFEDLTNPDLAKRSLSSMANIFAQVDGNFRIVSQECFDYFLKTQKASNQMWFEIETIRVEFYQDYLDALKKFN